MVVGGRMYHRGPLRPLSERGAVHPINFVPSLSESIAQRDHKRRWLDRKCLSEASKTSQVARFQPESESNLSANLIFIAVAKHLMAVSNPNRLVRREADLSVSSEIACQCRPADRLSNPTGQRSQRAIVDASGSGLKHLPISLVQGSLISKLAVPSPRWPLLSQQA